MATYIDKLIIRDPNDENLMAEVDSDGNLHTLSVITDGTSGNPVAGISDGRLKVEAVQEEGAYSEFQLIYDTGSGGINHALVDENGYLYVNIPPSSTNVTVEVAFFGEDTAVNNYEWQEVAQYTIPTGYDLNAVAFSAKSEVANEIGAAIQKEAFGSFVGATDTFTDGDSVSSPRFMSQLFIYVTTAFASGGANYDDITVTYTNEKGDTGRTGTVSIPKSSPIGTRMKVILQTGDIGITDVTNVTHSKTGIAGDFNVEGVLYLFIETLTSSGTQYNANSAGLGGVVVLEEEEIYLWYKADSANPADRDINMSATLVPKTV